MPLNRRHKIETGPGNGGVDRGPRRVVSFYLSAVLYSFTRMRRCACVCSCVLSDFPPNAVNDVAVQFSCFPFTYTLSPSSLLPVVCEDSHLQVSPFFRVSSGGSFASVLVSCSPLTSDLSSAGACSSGDAFFSSDDGFSSADAFVSFESFCEVRSASAKRKNILLIFSPSVPGLGQYPATKSLKRGQFFLESRSKVSMSQALYLPKRQPKVTTLILSQPLDMLANHE